MSAILREKRCPYLKEVVMIFCDAYPVKKLVPLDRITTASQCFGDGFHCCAMFTEIAARMRPVSEGKPAPPPGERRQRKRTAAGREVTP